MDTISHHQTLAAVATTSTISVDFVSDHESAESREATEITEIIIDDYVTNPTLAVVTFALFVARIMSRLFKAYADLGEYMIEKAFAFVDLTNAPSATDNSREDTKKRKKKGFQQLYFIARTVYIVCPR